MENNEEVKLSARRVVYNKPESDNQTTENSLPSLHTDDEEEKAQSDEITTKKQK